MGKFSKPLKILLVTAVFLSAVTAGAGYYLSRMVIKPKVWNYEDSYRCEIDNKRFTEEYYTNLPREDFYLDSPKGYRLHAVWIPWENSKKTIVFLHGHTFTLMGGYKYLPIFRKRGYNALLFDSRFHGKSGGPNITFGKHESADLSACIDWVQKRAGRDSLIGVHGESMGSAVGLIHAARDNRCSFYILDGAMADLTSNLTYRLKADFGLPSFPLMNAASLMSRAQGAMFFSEISPIHGLDKITASLFFITGGADRDIPAADNANKLFDAFKGIKKIWICPGAAHSKSVIVNPAEYENQVAAFLKEIDG